MSTQDGEGSGSPERIRIFLRVRPTARQTGRVVLGATEEPPWVEFHVPKNPMEGLINNSRESYRFAFDGLLPPDAQQQEVFERVALPVLRSALDGYNGTVFAFGQTGSGKTFTITGGADRYADRGLIPRALSALFAEAAQRTEHTYSVHVSYMEIYNETGFDLLDPGREVRALEDLPKVHIMEDDESRMHFRGLSLHRCSTEEQALNMLFLGDTNRVVAETPLNQASSRSHCVFTLHIEARRAGEAVVRRSKLHFVDLAGSERAGKTGLAVHTQLKEAKYINLSLHFLEQVICSLQEGRSHVPYRNSVLTMVLRDSLGGNTRTVMVAAVAPEAQHIEESITTCRFAQRVAMISNRVEVNEELDLEVVIKRLKAENTLLRQELQLLRSGASANGSSVGGSSAGASSGEGESGSEVAAAAAAAEEGRGQDGGGGSGGVEQRQALTEAEQHVLRRQVAAYLEDPSPDATLNVEASMLFIRAAFNMLKGMVRAAAPGGAAGSNGASLDQAAAAAELRSLRQLVQQQEQQIGVLAGVLRKQGAPAPGSGTTAGSTSMHSRQSSGSSSSSGSTGLAAAAGPARMSTGQRPGTPGSIGSARSSLVAGDGWQQQRQQQQQQPLPDQQQRQQQGPGGTGLQQVEAASTQPIAAPAYSDELLADQHKAFEFFCTTSPAHDAVAEHKGLLRGRYDEARALGARVSACKKRVGELKSSVEQRRLARSMAALLRQQQGGSAEEAEEERRAAKAEEEWTKGLIEQERRAYHEAYGQLKGVKAEIDGLQAALEHARARLQHDFQIWYAAMAGSGGSGSSHSAGHVPGQFPGQKAAATGMQAAVQQQGKALQAAEQQQQDWAIPAAAAAAQPHPISRSAAAAGLLGEAGAHRPSSPAGPSLGSWRLPPPAYSNSPYSSAAGAGGAPQLAPPQQRQQWQQAGPPMQAAARDGPPLQQQQHPQQQQQALQQPPQQQQPAPDDPPADPYAGVDPEVLAAAKPLLTGNPQADADIIKFYQARAALLKGMR